MVAKALIRAAALAVAVIALPHGAAADPAPAGGQPALEWPALEWIVPFQDGGGTDSWARVIAPVMAARLPGRPAVVIRNFPGGSSTRAANYFDAEARADGTTLLVTTGSTQFAWLLGDRRVQYDYADWTILAAAPTGGVVYVPASLGVKSMRELVARQRSLRFGSIGGTSLDIVPLLAFEMLGLDVKVVLGMSSRQAARLGTERGELDIDYQTTPAWIASVAPEVAAGRMVPLMTWGDGAGGRDPALPDVPTFAEVHAQIHGAAPAGIEARVWQALMVAGYGAQKMLFVPDSAAPETIRAYRAALADALADPAVAAEIAARLGPYPIMLGPKAEASLARATDLPPEIRDWTRDWLKTRFGIIP